MKKPIDILRRDALSAKFFGLGFIQVKINDRLRYHFYLADLDATIEDPHTHRYSFRSEVLAGKLYSTIHEFRPSTPGALPLATPVICAAVSCKAPGVTLDVSATALDAAPAFLPPSIAGSSEIDNYFWTRPGSSYWLHADTFHTAYAWKREGEEVTITRVTRSPIIREFAYVLRAPDAPIVCPFASTMTDAEVWEHIDLALNTVEIDTSRLFGH